MTKIPADLRLRPARPSDVPAINQLIATWAERKLMLPRTVNELYEIFRDFIIVEAEPGGLVGCAALHVVTGAIAELKSLAVTESAQGHGLGRRLVETCCAGARELGLERVFCLTYQVDFFAKQGFVKVDRSRLPEKVWGECIRCHRFLDCDEVAMWRTCAPVVGG